MSDNSPNPNDLGVQPFDSILEELGISNHELVAASTEQITHKMVTRGRKGRRLTVNVQGKLHRALNVASGKQFELGELFNYLGKS